MSDGSCVVLSFAIRVLGRVLPIIVGCTLLGKVAAAPPSQEPDWPCIQGFVSTLSVGSVWKGPSIDSVPGRLRGDAEIKALADRIASRDTSIDDAERSIVAFAGSGGADKNARLTELFAGTFGSIAEQREKAIRGIKNYARGQQVLAEKIAKDSAEAEQKRDAHVAETNQELQELLERLTWETRIFEDRERSLKHICEYPGLLEQRLFTLARAIMSHLE